MNIRQQICVTLFEKSKVPYALLFKRKKQPWNFEVQDLLNCQPNTLGHALGKFLSANNFSLIPRLERHDAYHVLTGFGTEVKDEIALQYLCFGNGKRSKYLWMVMVLGTMLNPEYFKYFLSAYRRGKMARQFYHWDFKNYLQRDLKELKCWVFEKENLYSFWKPLNN